MLFCAISPLDSAGTIGTACRNKAKGTDDIAQFTISRHQLSEGLGQGSGAVQSASHARRATTKALVIETSKEESTNEYDSRDDAGYEAEGDAGGEYEDDDVDKASPSDEIIPESSNVNDFPVPQ